MIACALIRITARADCVKFPMLRVLDLLGQCLFERWRFEAIHKPPSVDPA